MTSVHHKSGTDRCYEAYQKVGEGYDVIVNIQGDEPFIQRSQLEAIKSCFEDETTQIATLVKPFTVENGSMAWEMSILRRAVANNKFKAWILGVPTFPNKRTRRKKTGREKKNHKKGTPEGPPAGQGDLNNISQEYIVTRQKTCHNLLSSHFFVLHRFPAIRIRRSGILCSFF